MSEIFTPKNVFFSLTENVSLSISPRKTSFATVLISTDHIEPGLFSTGLFEILQQHDWMISLNKKHTLNLKQKASFFVLPVSNLSNEE